MTTGNVPSFYALPGTRVWHDYLNLLHLPYTLWNSLRLVIDAHRHSHKHSSVDMAGYSILRIDCATNGRAIKRPKLEHQNGILQWVSSGGRTKGPCRTPCGIA